MGKKKFKIKFIDKKKAISFHLVAKADHQDDEESEQGDAQVDDIAHERAELKRQLKLQRAEEREAAGLPPLDDEEADGEIEVLEEVEEESFVPKPAPDDRIQLMNMAAAAEGVETRAVRQARRALKESLKQKFYLQPNFNPHAPNAQIPADFPQEHLYTGAADAAEEEYWAKEDERKRELDRQARAPALLPHNYDYEKHLRPFSGRGVFMEAKRGDELYDAEHDPRDRESVPVAKTAVGGAAAASAAAASSGSMSLHSTAGEDEDDDMPALGAPGEEGIDEKPENPALLASVERLQRKLVKQGRRVRAEKDFVAALDGEHEEEFEQLQDDFVLQAMQGALDGQDDAEAEEEEEEGEDGEYYEEYEEYDEEDGEDEEEEEEEKLDAEGNPLPHTKRARRRAADEDEEGDEDAGAGGALDQAFDRLLEDEYSDGEIGELDDLAEDDPEALEGELELDQVTEQLDEFLHAKDGFKSQGGATIDTVEPALQALTLSKLALVTAGEKSLAQIEQDINDMLNPPVRETWDAESILSTYSNTENHPRVLRAPRRKKTSHIVNTDAIGMGGGSATRLTRQQLATFQPPIPEQRGAASSAAAAGGDDDIDEEDEEEDEEDNERKGGGGDNKGKARAADESLEEKKARKAAVKAAKREAKGRKKQLKTLYATETAAAVAKAAKFAKANPPGVKKL